MSSGKSLVIVESPNKVKTISKFLGSNYIVKSSVGHIRDLAKGTLQAPKKPKKSKESSDKSKHNQLIARMGIDPYNGWQANYEVLPGKAKVVNALKSAASKSNVIILATDLDREGEAIAWHIKELLGGENTTYQRVSFTEITKKAIKEAFSHPHEINMDRVHAQQARRFLDRVVGYMLSPLLWQKIARGLSAGRVQSVAVRLIADREREIHIFKPEEYWEIHAKFTKDDEVFTAQVIKQGDNNFRPNTGKESTTACQQLSTPGIKFQVTAVEKKPYRHKPNAPFITSTLQQAASVRLGYGVKRTMTIAQKLYEAGLITYMRTDSTNLSDDSVIACRQYIKKEFGKKYLPEQPNHYSSKKSAQEAHEAIRPTDINILKQDISNSSLDESANKLYELIWRQFVACQMPPAVYESTIITISALDYELRARGRILKFDGHTRVQTSTKKKGEEDKIPEVKEGEILPSSSLNPSQHFTKPSPRFTEASLVRELDKKGIGRPSTYHAIISTIQDRGYAALNGRKFHCLKMGEIVSDRLVENFSDLLDYGFTASMEEDLDSIASGHMNWRTLLDRFFADFVTHLEKAKINMRGNDPTNTEIICPSCKRNMMIRTARTGVFLGCSGYLLPLKERCKETINLHPGDDFIDDSDDDEGSVAEIQNRERCHKCEVVMDPYLIDTTRKIHICGNNPDCDSYKLEQGSFKLRGYEGPTIECDKCSNMMELKTGRFGKYFACNSAPECKNTRKLLKNGQPAPPRAQPVHMPELKCENSDSYFILRDGASGVFLASSAFPRSRETKKPYVSDLVRHKEELDPKLIYLTKAPQKDPQGNPTIIRFSRKTSSHYIMSEKDGRPTKWVLSWQNDKWEQKL